MLSLGGGHRRRSLLLCAGLLQLRRTASRCVASLVALGNRWLQGPVQGQQLEWPVKETLAPYLGMSIHCTTGQNGHETPPKPCSKLRLKGRAVTQRTPPTSQSATQESSHHPRIKSSPKIESATQVPGVPEWNSGQVCGQGTLCPGKTGRTGPQET